MKDINKKCYAVQLIRCLANENHRPKCRYFEPKPEAVTECYYWQPPREGEDLWGACSSVLARLTACGADTAIIEMEWEAINRIANPKDETVPLEQFKADFKLK